VLRSTAVPGADNREIAPEGAELAVPLERRGALLDLATDALEEGRISYGRWRELLQLTNDAEARALLEERRVAAPQELYLGA
jgi:hypothetical protein